MFKIIALWQSKTNRSLSGPAVYVKMHQGDHPQPKILYIHITEFRVYACQGVKFNGRVTKWERKSWKGNVFNTSQSYLKESVV